MKIDILTLFPKMFEGPFNESIVKRAIDNKLVEVNIHNLRDWATDKHKSVDDRPFGGGVGMILRVDILYNAIYALIPKKKVKTNHKIILLDAKGSKFTQKKALEYSKLDSMLLIAGHYEGFDARIHEHLVDDVISVGDYVLTGGEIPAMVMVDTITRLVPGVLEKPQATELESFTNNSIEYPQYTRPVDFKGWKVPDVLLSGNHKEIEKWRKEKSIEETKLKRPDLMP